MTTSQQHDNSYRSLIVTAGGWITGVSLILIGISSLFYPGMAEGYGVFPVDEKGAAYLLATGMRDLSLGGITLLMLTRFRSGMAMYFCLLMIIPIADVLINLKYGSSTLSLIVHVVGVIGLVVMTVFAFRENLPAHNQA